MSGGSPKDWEKTQKYINELQANPASLQQASQNTLNAYGPMLPELLGGSADLSQQPDHLEGSVSLKEDRRATTF